MQDKNDVQSKLFHLNKLFVEEVEKGKGWDELKEIIEEMKVLTKELDHLPATVISFDNYTGDKKTNVGS
jgi:hypothetical protein